MCDILSNASSQSRRIMPRLAPFRSALSMCRMMVCIAWMQLLAKRKPYCVFCMWWSSACAILILMIVAIRL